jgi:hypothetical protein
MLIGNGNIFVEMDFEMIKGQFAMKILNAFLGFS